MKDDNFKTSEYASSVVNAFMPEMPVLQTSYREIPGGAPAKPYIPRVYPYEEMEPQHITEEMINFSGESKDNFNKWHAWKKTQKVREWNDEFTLPRNIKGALAVVKESVFPRECGDPYYGEMNPFRLVIDKETGEIQFLCEEQYKLDIIYKKGKFNFLFAGGE